MASDLMRQELEEIYAGEFMTNAVCECGYRTRAPFGDLFHVHLSCCPLCGSDKKYPTWRVKTERYISTSRLFRPSTWGTGYWQSRDELPSPVFGLSVKTIEEPHV
jgi:hypothetical protein